MARLGGSRKPGRKKQAKSAEKCHVPESSDPTRGQNMALTFCNWQVFKTITQEINFYKDEVS